MIKRFAKAVTAWQANRRGSVRWKGATLYFPRDSQVALGIVRTGGWVLPVTALIETAARDGTTVFDVGANVGGSALPLLAAHDTISVVSFEPSPSVLPYLMRTRDESPYRARWDVVPKAATASPDTEVSFIRFGGAGDVYEGLRDTGRGGAGVTITIPATSLDAEWAVRGRPQVSLVKVDVEGAELGVLAGARECIRQCRPAIVTEWYRGNYSAYGHTAAMMFDAAGEMDYDVYSVPEIVRVADGRMFELHLATHHDFILYPRPNAATVRSFADSR